MLKKIFEHNREEATGWYRRFNIEELHDLYFSLGIIRMMKLRTMTEAREEEKSYKDLVGET